MALRFCFFNGEAMPMKPGLPADYDGTVLQGSTATHITTSNGTIINQEYNNVFFSLIKTSIRCIKPEIINCVYEYPHGVFSRISLTTSIHETLLGAGRISLRKNQFSIVAGSQWQGHLELKKPGHYSFYNLHWSSDYVNDIFDKNPAVFNAVQNAVPRLPVRLIGPENFINVAMKNMLHDIINLNLTNKKNISWLGHLIKIYFTEMITEWHSYDPVKRRMSEKNWQAVHAAKRLIDDDLSKKFTTREISKRINTNEYNLKKHFLLITCMTIEEYRKYHLLTKAGRKIILIPDDLLKNRVAESGYSNMHNFSRGFLAICGCRPTYLKRPDLNIENIDNDKFPEL